MQPENEILDVEVPLRSENGITIMSQNALSFLVTIGLLRSTSFKAKCVLLRL